MVLVAGGYEVAEDGVGSRVWIRRRCGWGTVWVEKRISPLRCSQKREQLRSK